jgi:hypothetical protein
MYVSGAAGREFFAALAGSDSAIRSFRPEPGRR